MEDTRWEGLMRSFASWWERFPKHEAAALIAVVVAVDGTLNMPDFVRLLVGPAGFLWG